MLLKTNFLYPDGQKKRIIFYKIRRKSKYNVLCKYIFGNVKQLAKKSQLFAYF